MQSGMNAGMGCSAIAALLLVGFFLGVVAMHRRYKRVIGALKAVSININYSAQVYQAFGAAPERPVMTGGIVDPRCLPAIEQQPDVLPPVPRYRQLEGGNG